MQDRAVVAVKPASQPISVAVLVDTAQGTRVTDAYGTPEEYVRDIRVAIGGFAQAAARPAPDAQVSLMEFGQAAITMVPVHRESDGIRQGRQPHRRRARASGRCCSKRWSGEQGSRRAAEHAPRDRVAQPRAERRAEPRGPEQGIKDGVPEVRRAALGGVGAARRPEELEARLVLNDFAKATGGQRDFIVGISAVAGS